MVRSTDMKRDEIKSDPFARASDLSRRLSRLREHADIEYGYGLLNGVDLVSRALAQVPSELKRQDWEQLPPDQRERLTVAYRGLGSAAINMAYETGLNTTGELPEIEDDERMQLVKYAQVANHVGGTLGSLQRFDETRELVNMGEVVNLTDSALKALLEWQDYQAYFGVGSNTSSYSLNKMSVGLDAIGRVCDENSEIVDTAGTSMVPFVEQD